MNRLKRAAALALPCGLLIAGPTIAGIPSTVTSTLYPITLSDRSNPLVPNFIIIRDGNGNVLPHVSVTLDFSECAPPALPVEVKIATDQDDPDVTVHCQQRLVVKATDASGKANFYLIGDFDFLTYCPSAPPDCVKVYADGVFMGRVAVTSSRYDLDFNGVVDPSDLSTWLDYFGTYASGGPYCWIADLSADGTIGALDLSIWLDGYGLAQGVYTGLFCP